MPCLRGSLLDSIGAIVYSLFMDKTTSVWRPVIPHELRHEAGKAGAEHDLGPAAFVLLCVRYVLDRLGKLPTAFVLSDDERFITTGWDLVYSSFEVEVCAKVPPPTPRLENTRDDEILKCATCGVVEPNAVAWSYHVCGGLKRAGYG